MSRGDWFTKLFLSLVNSLRTIMPSSGDDRNSTIMVMLVTDVYVKDMTHIIWDLDVEDVGNIFYC